VLEKAAGARYSAWSLRETPGEIERRWFRAEGREFVLDPSIRSAVSFEERNLTQGDSTFWRPGRFDIVFCRNVIMYFELEAAQQVVARLARRWLLAVTFSSDTPNAARVVERFPSAGRPRHVLLPAKGRPGACARPGRSHRGLEQPPLPSLLNTDWANSWIETVQRAADRIKTLTETVPSAEAAKAPTARAVGVDLSVAIELLKNEPLRRGARPSRAPASTTARDPGVILLRAVLLTHAGEIDSRARSARSSWSSMSSTPAPITSSRSAQRAPGQLQNAVEEDQIAVYLDPGFAMPHLHLGLMARRSGDLETAQRELSRAALLLGWRHLALVALRSGFGRDSLVALCKAELGRLERDRESRRESIRLCGKRATRGFRRFVAHAPKTGTSLFEDFLAVRIGTDP